MSSPVDLTLRSTKCCAPGKTLKATFLDSLTIARMWYVGCAFFFCVILTVIIGAVGPTAALSKSWQVSAPYDSTKGGYVNIGLLLTDLSKWNQVTWVTLSVNRPLLEASGTVVSPEQPYVFSLPWTLVLTGSSRFYCELQFQNPLQAWAGFLLKPGVVFSVNQGYLNPKYTEFEAGFKVFYCVITIIIWIFYMWSLFYSPGAKDSSGVPLTTTHEQWWLAVLGGWLFFFNDPNFITYLSNPTYSGAGFTALCTATFLSLLLFFFLCLADNARLVGETGFRWHLDGNSRITGACYWIPKTLLCCAIWVISLALYMFQRLASLTDPSFTYSDYFGGFYMTVGTNIVLGVGIVYVLYFFSLLVLAFRAFKTSSPSSRFLLAVSVTTLLLTLVGLFSQAFSATRNTTILFLSAYGVPSLYIWMLLLLFRPAPAPESWSANTLGALEGPAEGDAGEGGGEEKDLSVRGLTQAEWETLDSNKKWEIFEELRGKLHRGRVRKGGVGGEASGEEKNSTTTMGETLTRDAASAPPGVVTHHHEETEAEHVEIEFAAHNNKTWQ